MYGQDRHDWQSVSRLQPGDYVLPYGNQYGDLGAFLKKVAGAAEERHGHLKLDSAVRESLAVDERRYHGPAVEEGSEQR